MEEKKDDDITIDFSKIKNAVKGFFSSEGKKNQDSSDIVNQEPAEDEQISLALQARISSMKKYVPDKKILIPLLLIIIAVFFAVYFRSYPASMPITDEWAANVVYQHYQQQIRETINNEYPNLPSQNKESLIDQEFKKFLQENKAKVENDISTVSAQYKELFS